MLQSMVARLSGTMEEADNGPGLRVTVSAPIGEEGGRSRYSQRVAGGPRDA